MKRKDPKEIFKQEKRTVGQIMADNITRFAGSWTFILFFLFGLVLWMAINGHSLWGTNFDPYPFILLNLVLSCLAALQAPIILMSQSRQAYKDSILSEQDYLVDVEAERKIHEMRSLMFELKSDLEKIKKNTLVQK